jgi:hypothetical protein
VKEPPSSRRTASASASPFVLVALGADELHRRMHLFARHEMAVGLISGALLVTAGFLMITDLFGRLSGALPPIGL